MADSEQMYYQSAPFDHLCSCVTVLLTASQERLYDRKKPHQRGQMIEGLIRGGESERICDADCHQCKGLWRDAIPE